MLKKGIWIIFFLQALSCCVSAQDAKPRLTPAPKPPATQPTKPQSTPAPKPTTSPILQTLASNMVYIPGGTFWMGCSPGDTECDADESPRHQVTLSPYYIGKYEVTQAEWRAVMGNNPSNNSGCDACPVEQVSWNDVQSFIKKLNNLTGQRYRLPTEAEWEYAARGGNKSMGYQYSGSNDLGSVAWYKDNSNSKSHLIGLKQANELGLYDMTGNVWEWCSDWYAESYYSSSPSTNPHGPSNGVYRAFRGGSWNHDARYCRVSYRYRVSPVLRFNFLGFRLARD